MVSRDDVTISVHSFHILVVKHSRYEVTSVVATREKARAVAPEQTLACGTKGRIIRASWG